MAKYTKLDPVFKKRWINALRSGEYKKTTGTLHGKEGSQDTYCVLGVAYKVAYPNKIPRGGSLNRSMECIPKELTGNDDLQEILIERNDEKKWSFKRFATWIDRYL